MSRIQTPLKAPELHLDPELSGGIELSDNMQQVLSLLTGFWRNKRVLLKASPTGILQHASPQLKDIVHYTGSGADDDIQGDDLPCSEIICIAHPDNAGRIWVKPHIDATSSNGWPLDAGDIVSFGLTNLSMLHIHVVTDADKLIVAYTD